MMALVRGAVYTLSLCVCVFCGGGGAGRSLPAVVHIARNAQWACVRRLEGRALALYLPCLATIVHVLDTFVRAP